MISESKTVTTLKSYSIKSTVYYELVALCCDSFFLVLEFDLNVQLVVGLIIVVNS